MSTTCAGGSYKQGEDRYTITWSDWNSCQSGLAELGLVIGDIRKARPKLSTYKHSTVIEVIRGVKQMWIVAPKNPEAYLSAASRNSIGAVQIKESSIYNYGAVTRRENGEYFWRASL